MEKSKARFDLTAEELERVLVAKEGESMKETAMRSPGSGGGGKRALGKAVQKGGLLLKGKNPQNVRFFGLNSTAYLLILIVADPTTRGRCTSTDVDSI